MLEWAGPRAAGRGRTRWVSGREWLCASIRLAQGESALPAWQRPWSSAGSWGWGTPHSAAPRPSLLSRKDARGAKLCCPQCSRRSLSPHHPVPRLSLGCPQASFPFRWWRRGCPDPALSLARLRLGWPWGPQQDTYVPVCCHAHHPLRREPQGVGAAGSLHSTPLDPSGSSWLL